MSDLVSTIEEHIKNMPSLPTSVVKVLEVCNNPQTSPADLNHIISLDPVLTGRVLKLINSAYYGLDQQVTSVVRAIIMLGINTVKNLALSTAVMGNLSGGKESQGLDMEGFWRHSLCAGVTAKILAKRRGVDSKQIEEYFTAGLLHDIGKIPLNAVLANDYMLTVSAADRERQPLFTAENRAIGINHCGSGAMIVKAWKLDGPIGDAVSYHHGCDEYSGAYADVVHTVIAANRFSSLIEIGFSGDRYPEKIEDYIWESLRVDQTIFDGIEETVNTEIEKAKIFLKL